MTLEENSSTTETQEAIPISQEANENEEIKNESSDSNLVLDCEVDKNLYDEILEKLDIKKINKQDIQENLMQETKKRTEQKAGNNNLLGATQAEQFIAGDFDKIQKLTTAGLISSEQGQNLKKLVLKKAFDKLVQSEKIKRATASESVQKAKPFNKSEIFDEFHKNNPDFFAPNGRKDILDYLKSDDVVLGKDDIERISKMVRTVEQSAIERYLQKVAYEKTLRSSNEIAKQRLTANAQKSGFGDKNIYQTFTREQIGNMTSAEFIKYEPIIMEQLKKGLIR